MFKRLPAFNPPDALLTALAVKMNDGKAPLTDVKDSDVAFDNETMPAGYAFVPGPNHKMGDFILAADAIDPRARIQTPEEPEDPNAPELPEEEAPEVPDAGRPRLTPAQRSSRNTS
jgi:hypothetical protein